MGDTSSFVLRYRRSRLALAVLVGLGTFGAAGPARADAPAPLAPSSVSVTNTGVVTWVDTAGGPTITGHHIVETDYYGNPLDDATVGAAATSYALPMIEASQENVCVSTLSDALESTTTCTSYNSSVNPDTPFLNGTAYDAHGRFVLRFGGVQSFGGSGGHYLTTVDGADADLQNGADVITGSFFDLSFLSLGTHTITLATANDVYTSPTVSTTVDVLPPEYVPGIPFDAGFSDTSTATRLGWLPFDDGGGPATVHVRVDGTASYAAPAERRALTITWGQGDLLTQADGHWVRRPDGTHLVDFWASNLRGDGFVLSQWVVHGGGPNSPKDLHFDIRTGKLTWGTYPTPVTNPRPPVVESAAVYVDGHVLASNLPAATRGWQLTHLAPGQHVLEASFSANGHESFSDVLVVSSVAPAVTSVAVTRPLRDHELVVSWRDVHPTLAIHDVVTVRAGSRVVLTKTYAPGTHSVGLAGLPAGEWLTVSVSSTTLAGTSTRTLRAIAWRSVPTRAHLVGWAHRTPGSGRVTVDLSYGEPGARHVLRGATFSVQVVEAGRWQAYADGVEAGGSVHVDQPPTPGHYRVVIPTQRIRGVVYAGDVEQFWISR